MRHYIKYLPVSTCSLSVNTFLLALFALKGEKKRYSTVMDMKKIHKFGQIVLFWGQGVMQNPADTLNRCSGAHVR